MNYKPDGERVMMTVRYLYEQRERGATWWELSEHYGWHHGKSSAVLSTLHKQDRIARLTEKRGKSFVYVDKMFVNGRETTPYGRKVMSTYSDEELDQYINIALEDAQRAIYGMAHIAKGPVRTHYNGCWRDHVSCALIAAAKQIEARRSDVSKKRAS